MQLRLGVRQPGEVQQLYHSDLLPQLPVQDFQVEVCVTCPSAVRVGRRTVEVVVVGGPGLRSVVVEVLVVVWTGVGRSVDGPISLRAPVSSGVDLELGSWQRTSESRLDAPA